MIFGCILVILLLAVSIIIFFIIYQKRLLAQQIRLQHVKSDYQHQLLLLSIEAQEKERVRIGHDLHDEIGSSLSTIKLLINHVQCEDEESQRIVLSVKNILIDTIQNVRNISMNLYPSVLQKFGLADALQYMVNVLTEVSPLKFDFTADELTSLTFMEELALYRIAQELVNNTIKHAGATHVLIELAQHDQVVSLRVQDNGCGFDYKELEKNSNVGIGLKSIEARKAMLHADMQINSVEGQGSQITITLPHH